MAYNLADTLPRSAETSTALRKLLEAKDAAVRAAVEGHEAQAAMTEHMSTAANPEPPHVPGDRS